MSVVVISVMLVRVGAGPPQPPRAPRWTPVVFDDIRETHYSVDQGERGTVLRAESRSGSSALAVELPEGSGLSEVGWRWRVSRCLDPDLESQGAGADYAARVLVLFGRWGGNGWSIFRRLIPRPRFGDIRPDRALGYVWAAGVPVGRVLPSPRTDSVRALVLQSGCVASAGETWKQERRDLREDFSRAFGNETMPPVLGLALMTDADDTDGQALAWYADVSVTPADGQPLALPFGPN